MNEEERKVIIKGTFNSVHDNYDSFPLRFFSESAKYLDSLLFFRGDEKVIDVATGTGNLALTVAGRLLKGSVTGIDFSEGMLKEAREKGARNNVRNVEFVEMDMQNIKFPSASFDFAICAFGIFFVEDMDTQLSEIARVVKPGGKIAICNFREDYFNPLRELLITRLSQYNVPLPPQVWKRIAHEAGCKELFEKAGLQDIRVVQKNMGYFLSDEKEWWSIVWNAGFRRMVSQLSPTDLERFRQEHLEEVAALSTRDGIWLDVGVLYTTGVKQHE